MFIDIDNVLFWIVVNELSPTTTCASGCGLKESRWRDWMVRW